MTVSPFQFQQRRKRAAFFAGLLAFLLMTPMTIVASFAVDQPSMATLQERTIRFFSISVGVFRNWLFDAYLFGYHKYFYIAGIPPLSNDLRGWDYTSSISEQGLDGAVYGRLAIAALGGLAFAFPFAAMAALRASRTRSVLWVDGPALIHSPRAAKRARTVSAAEIKTSGSGIEIAPGVPISRAREIRSLLILGAQRSGKTVVLRSLIRQLLARNAKLIVHDTKGDMTRDWPSDDAILFAPQDTRSWGWDIGRDIQGPLASYELAVRLIPESKGDPGWAQGAHEILKALLLSLQAEFQTNWGWRELRNVMELPPARMHAQAAKISQQAASLLSLDETGERFTKNAQSYVNTLIAPLARVVQPLAAAWGDLDPKFRISLTEWLSDSWVGPRTLILQRMPQFPKFSSLWVTAAINHMVSVTGGANFPDDNDRRIWFLMDEFPQLGKIETLFEVPSTHAAKGVCLVLVMQSLAQVTEAYGNHATSAISSLMGTKIILRIEKGEDAEYVAKNWIGNWRYRVPERAANAGRRNKPDKVTDSKDGGPEPLLLTSEFQRLGRSYIGIRGFLMNLDENIYEFDWPLEDWPQQRAGSVQAAWVTAIHPRNDTEMATPLLKQQRLAHD